MQESYSPLATPRPAPPPNIPGASILPDAGTRALISSAVHEAVCAHTESNGVGHCAVYAAVGMMVMSKLTGRRYVFQAGDIYITLSDTYRRKYPDGSTHFCMLGSPPREGAPSRAAGPLPEFHAWFGAKHPPARDTPATRESARAEIIDLASRHYAAHVNALDPFWTPPQDFTHSPLWTTGDRMPEWLALIPNEQATRDVAAKITSRHYAVMTGRAILDALEALAARGLREDSLSATAGRDPRPPGHAPDLISAIEI